MKSSTSRWQTLSTKVAYQNQWFSVERNDVIRPDGQPGIYEVIKKKNVAVIVALNRKDEICIIGQQRYATNMYSLELPGGNIDSESPLHAAKKELLEETGLEATSWKKLATIQTANGTMDELCYIFLATGLTQTGTNNQIDEGIDSQRWVSISEAMEMIKSGTINEGQAIAGITIAAMHLNMLK